MGEDNDNDDSDDPEEEAPEEGNRMANPTLLVRPTVYHSLAIPPLTVRVTGTPCVHE